MSPVRFLPLVVLAALATVGAAQNPVDPNRTVATINGDEIKGAEYYRRMEFLPGVGKNFGRVFSEFPPGLLALDAIITDRLILQMARDKGLLPSELEVTKEIERRIGVDPAYATRWNEAGRTSDELREVVRLELAQFKLQTEGITITDQEVQKYYNENPERSTVPTAYKLRVIAVADKAGQEAVDADLRKGTAFGEVAKARSLDSSRANGGAYATVPESALSASMRTAITKLKPGGTTDWIEANQGDVKGFVKFLVEAVVPAKRLPLDAAMKFNIRREMLLQRGRIRNDVPAAMREMRRKARIDIASPQFAAAYKSFIEGYLGNGTPPKANGGR